MKLNYKARLAVLGKHQVDLIPDIQKQLDMYTISPEAVSRALNFASSDPKHQSIRLAADAILDEWEEDDQKKGGNGYGS